MIIFSFNFRCLLLVCKAASECLSFYRARSVLMVVPIIVYFISILNSLTQFSFCIFFLYIRTQTRFNANKYTCTHKTYKNAIIMAWRQHTKGIFIKTTKKNLPLLREPVAIPATDLSIWFQSVNTKLLFFQKENYLFFYLWLLKTTNTNRIVFCWTCLRNAIFSYKSLWSFTRFFVRFVPLTTAYNTLL